MLAHVRGPDVPVRLPSIQYLSLLRRYILTGFPSYMILCQAKMYRVLLMLVLKYLLMNSIQQLSDCSLRYLVFFIK